MRLISLNCGLPRRINWQGMDVTTSIFKDPVAGRVRLRALNLDGDRQSDLSVHGRKDKAVYCYPTEHYSYWQSKVPNHSLDIGVLARTSPLRACLKNQSMSAAILPLGRLRL